MQSFWSIGFGLLSGFVGWMLSEFLAKPFRRGVDLVAEARTAIIIYANVKRGRKWRLEETTASPESSRPLHRLEIVMTTSEWLSTLALIISSGGFSLQARNWWLSGPRLHLSVMGEAIAIPNDGQGTRAALTVINRGTDPTMLTHMVVFTFESRWRRFRNKASKTGVVNSPNIPAKLDVNATWMGQMFYTDDLRKAHAAGQLYIGLIASHSNKTFLVHVPPPKRDNAPKKIIAAGK
jgi:hypothetical protein